MAGVPPADVRMHERYQALERTRSPAVGETCRGHEFHYSSADVAADERFAFDAEHGSGTTDDTEGLTEYATLGTYRRCHDESGAFDAFIDRV